MNDLAIAFHRLAARSFELPLDICRALRDPRRAPQELPAVSPAFAADASQDAPTAPPSRSSKPKRARRPTLASLNKQAKKAGLPIKSAVIDGIELKFGDPDAAPTPTNDLDKWLAKHPTKLGENKCVSI